MIFQLSDWFPKTIKCAIIVKFDQKNWWRISCAEILEVGKNFFAASSVKKMSRFEEVSPEKIKRIAWKFTKTVILLGLAGYELIITNEAVGRVGYILLDKVMQTSESIHKHAQKKCFIRRKFVSSLQEALNAIANHCCANEWMMV